MDFPAQGRHVDFNPAMFPTPSMLAEAQRRYNAEKRGARVRLDKEGVPLPFPPRTPKAAVFNPADFKAIDQHAQRV